MPGANSPTPVDMSSAVRCAKFRSSRHKLTCRQSSVRQDLGISRPLTMTNARPTVNFVPSHLLVVAAVVTSVIPGCYTGRTSAVADPAGIHRLPSAGGRNQPPSSRTTSGPLVYRIAEDLEPGTVVADLRRDAELDRRFPGLNRSTLELLRFTLLPRNDGAAAGGGGNGPSSPGDGFDDADPNRHFSLDPVSGLIRTVTTLDRDRICPGAVNCSLDVDVVTQPSKYFTVIKVMLINRLSFKRGSSIYTELLLCASGEFRMYLSAYETVCTIGAIVCPTSGIRFVASLSTSVVSLPEMSR